MSAEEVAKAFVQHYYNTFDSDAGNLQGLFQANSMMTFEGEQKQGPENIVGKLRALGPIKHVVKSTDIQPGIQPNTIIIFVTGSVQIGDGGPLHYCEFFQLVGTAPGQYYVHNCVFRLNYGL